ncbi:tRNA glutamyl-Q(34) synthetase GluQRS [uncultured Tateyamaria sp.]|uniref:tRNA glutamyl-Q(34) synthetase GluQRS n=1 Tax=uncultured Tateyamaria sp. TaxID=455651 RepID=UPI002636837A|nr:tRNA glutamyl-Q(34) synthetase GluQRS [uncultured Tateyamaria sp.]
MTFVTRFAPSPTGPLHLGHAYSAMLAHDMARAENGTFLLRMEDIDQSRARPEWEEQIYDDLRWLDVEWDGPVLRQSDNLDAYSRALDTLWRRRLVYPCTCTRADIKAATSAPQEGVPTHGPDGLIYPGTCREMTWERTFPDTHPRPQGETLRLDMAQAVLEAGFEYRIDGTGPWASYLGFTESGAGPNGEKGRIEFGPDMLPNTAGDIVLARRDMGTSYHLSVVVDDAVQGITHVVRGADLFDATSIHVLLQRLLGLPTPTYHHHNLIRDDTGKRLAKRDDARAISKYRADGATPEDIRAMVGLPSLI